MFEKITTQQKKDLVETLSLLIKSGTPISDAFITLKEQTESPVLKEVLQEARNRTRQGTPIYEVFEDDPNFEKSFSSFVKAGEETGTIEENLNYLGDWLSRKDTLEREISSATLYPKIILAFSLILGGSLTFFVLPRLVPIFTSLGVELPLISRILLSFSELVQNHGIKLLAGIAAFVGLIYGLTKIQKVKEIFDDLVLKIPFFGSLVADYQLATISHLISTLFGSGIMVTKTLEIAAESVTNTNYKESLEYSKKRVVKGDSLSDCLSDFPNLYPELYINIISTGEKTGSFTESFSYLSNFYSTRITEKTKKIPVVIEPIILIAIGIFVAFVAGAVILPIYQVTEGLY